MSHRSNLDATPVRQKHCDVTGLNADQSAPPEPPQCRKCNACQKKNNVDVTECLPCYTKAPSPASMPTKARQQSQPNAVKRTPATQKQRQ